MSRVRIQTVTESDLRAITQVHLLAFPGSALTALGGEAVRRYYEWQFRGPHDAVTLGAWDDDSHLAGFCFGGLFRGATGGFVRKNRNYLAGRVLMRPWLVTNPIFQARAATAIRALRPGASRQSTADPSGSAPKSFGILAIAVHPDRQQLGIGRALMDACETIARRRGFEQMHLTVHPQNSQAVAFYERLGWEPILEQGNWRGAMRKPLRALCGKQPRVAAIDVMGGE